MIEIDPDAHITVFDYAGLKEYIAGLLDGPVDVVSRDGVNPMFVRRHPLMRSMPSKSPLTVLHDTLHRIELAEHFVTGVDNEAFLAGVRTVYAVTRCLEVISEVSREMGIEADGLDLHSGFNILKQPDLVLSHPPYHNILVYRGNVWDRGLILTICRVARVMINFSTS